MEPASGDPASGDPASGSAPAPASPAPVAAAPTSPPCADPGGCAPLYQTVATRGARTQLSQFLVAAAKRAARARDWARAIPLYQGLVVARGAGSDEARQLAVLWTLAGQTERAAEAWSDYAAAARDPAARADARAEATRLAGVHDPFADNLVLIEQTAAARRAFALGRAAFAARRFGDALVYFHMGHALAPDLPGFLRELGATYDRLGAPELKREFYRRYLVQRPIGANANVVRAELARDRDQLGTLQVSSSLPCTELWINRQRLTGKPPDKGILVAPGSYKGLCFHTRFQMALFEYASVEAGKTAAMTFRWAIVENRLERPLGRIALENAKAPGMMIDLGITSNEIGVAAPADGRKLKMILKDDSSVRTETRMVLVEPGQRIPVKW